MSTREPVGSSRRFFAGVTLLVALFGFAWWTGAAAVEPLESGYPDEGDVTSDREAYIGARVVLGGTVVETEPVVIATRTGGDGRFTVVNAADGLQHSAPSFETGDRVTVFGTLENESTIDADRTVTDGLWGSLYLVVASVGGGCWVLARLVRGWHVDRDRLVLVPRTAAQTTRTATQTTDGRRGTDPDTSLGDATAADDSSGEHRDRPDTGRHRDGGDR